MVKQPLFFRGCQSVSQLVNQLQGVHAVCWRFVVPQLGHSFLERIPFDKFVGHIRPRLSSHAYLINFHNIGMF